MIGVKIDAEQSLMSLADLREELQNRDVIRVPLSTFRRWATRGVRCSNGEVIHLRTKRIGKKKMSSVAWFAEFLDDAEF